MGTSGWGWGDSRRRLHSSRQLTAVRARLGGAPAALGWGFLVEELPFWGLVRVEEGWRWGFIVGRISPAIMGGGGAPRRVWWLWALEYVLERSSVR